MAEQNQQPGSTGQVKDQEGARGRRISEQQDVGELSAQNRGGTTGRGLEESKRLEEDDREQAAAASQPQAPSDAAADEETCDATAELNELFAQEDRPAPKKRHGGSSEAPAAEDNLAERAQEEALNRDTESYVDDPNE